MTREINDTGDVYKKLHPSKITNLQEQINSNYITFWYYIIPIGIMIYCLYQGYNIQVNKLMLLAVIAVGILTQLHRSSINRYIENQLPDNTDDRYSTLRVICGYRNSFINKAATCEVFWLFHIFVCIVFGFGGFEQLTTTVEPSVFFTNYLVCSMLFILNHSVLMTLSNLEVLMLIKKRQIFMR